MRISAHRASFAPTRVWLGRQSKDHPTLQASLWGVGCVGQSKEPWRTIHDPNSDVTARPSWSSPNTSHPSLRLVGLPRTTYKPHPSPAITFRWPCVIKKCRRVWYATGGVPSAALYVDCPQCFRSEVSSICWVYLTPKQNATPGRCVILCRHTRLTYERTGKY